MEFQLRSLALENYRCFSSAELKLGGDLTVLIADNGIGKSATLDAVATALAQLVGPLQLKSKAPSSDRLNLRSSDATTSNALPPYSDSEFPVRVETSALIDEQEVTWAGTKTEDGQSASWDIPQPASDVASPRTRRLGRDVTLPVFAHYGTNRSASSVVQSKPPSLGRPDRGFGYQNALHGRGALNELGPWLAQGEWERSGRGVSVWDAALDAVYEASADVLGSHGVTRVSYSMEDRDLILDFGVLIDDDATGRVVSDRPGGAVIPMHLVADGYRSVLGMVSDLAFRCGVLNAHLEGEAPQLTSGVVLIDEIDMHLHPSWQTHVLHDLQRAFPRIQFVVTTHSPFVLSSVQSGAVRRIVRVDGRSQYEEPSEATEGVRIELLTEALLGSPVRAGTGITQLLSSLAAALGSRDLEMAEAIADDIDDEQRADPDVQRLLSELRWRQQRGDR